MANILALVTFNIYPPLMGGQKGVALFYKYLNRHHHIIMAAARDNMAASERGIKVLPVLFGNKKILLNYFRLEQLLQLIKQHHIQCIIAEHSYAGWIGYLLKRKTNIPLIIHSHNLESYRFQQMHRRWWKLYGYYEKWIHQQADYNFFISETDRQKAKTQFNLDEDKCTVITYGIEPADLIPNAKAALLRELNLTGNPVVLFFNGTLDYRPNYEAVEILLYKLQPLLEAQFNNYKMVITGNRPPQALLRKMNAGNNCIYKGYVNNINLYYQGADVFINPIMNDSGVKTKVIEALANHCTVVSTASGAAGIPQELGGEKLLVVRDNDWKGFAEQMIISLNQHHTLTPAPYYDYFSWSNIAAKAAQKINELIVHHG